MGKLPSDLIDPIDQIFYTLTDYFIPFFHKLEFTPNILTTIGNIFGIISIHFLYNNNFKIFLFFSSVRYFFDCADGQMARKYKMYSKFGDIYDHISDYIYTSLVVGISLIYVKNINIYILILISIAFMCGLNWTCEGNVLDYKSPFYIKGFEKKKCIRSLRFLRFFGPAMSWIYFFLCFYIFKIK